MHGKIALLMALVFGMGASGMQASFAQAPDEPLSPSSLDAGELFCGLPLSSFSKVIDGTPGPDVLRGTPGNDLIRGFAGDDRMFGNGGDDCLKGYEGSDSVWGGGGDDYILGLDGSDKLVGDAGNDTVFGGNDDDNIWGNAGDDDLMGEAGDDQAHGDAGDDSVFGNEGKDYLWGGADNDTMSGGADDDKLAGDGGDDRMWGGDGEDTLLGLAGDDKLVGDEDNDKLYGHEGSDSLYDDDGDDGLNGGADIDSCYDIVGSNVFFNCEEPGSKDQKGDSAFRDFDIKNYGFDEDGEAFLEVYGQAGKTLPSGEKTILAYVIFTDNGTYASDSHEAQHADDEETANLSWHGHMIVLDSEGCIDEVDGFKSRAHLTGDRIVITDTDATEITKVQTVRLELQVDDPDNPPPGVTCLAKVVEVFDEAVPAA
jgi:hypothetical protein